VFNVLVPDVVRCDVTCPEYSIWMDMMLDKNAHSMESGKWQITAISAMRRSLKMKELWESTVISAS
jgi:hypothetical protein